MLVQNVQPKTFNTVLFTKQICVIMLFRQNAISAPLMFEAIFDRYKVTPEPGKLFLEFWSPHAHFPHLLSTIFTYI